MTKQQILSKPYLKLSEIKEITGLSNYTIKKEINRPGASVYRLNTKYYNTDDVCRLFNMMAARKRAINNEFK